MGIICTGAGVGAAAGGAIGTALKCKPEQTLIIAMMGGYAGGMAGVVTVDELVEAKNSLRLINTGQ